MDPHSSDSRSADHKTVEVLDHVRSRIIPDEEERARVLALAESLKSKLEMLAKSEGLPAEVVLGGSVAKNTWLRGKADIDLFLMIPPELGRAAMNGLCLALAKKAVEGSRWLERYAEHPYVEAFVDGLRVDIVPCFKVEREKWLSAVDRTPFHTEYVNPKMDELGLRDDARLLKQFMEGVGVYGAEVKVGGFSGYLCELLTLHFGSFVAVLGDASMWRGRIVIDPENLYGGRTRDVEVLFEGPLVVIDPVDRNRNVAAAVNGHSYFSFIAAAQLFRRLPRIDFFFPVSSRKDSAEHARGLLKERCLDVIAISFDVSPSIPDVLWGQLIKSTKSIERILEIHDFTVTRSGAWTDENSRAVMIFEMESSEIPTCKQHWGPPVSSVDSEDFLIKHLGAPSTASGPWVEDGRWVVATRRRFVDCLVLLRERLGEGGAEAGISAGLRDALRRSLVILVNDEVSRLCDAEGFASFLEEFLVGTPRWLAIGKDEANRKLQM